jgi:hypothetical protein
VFLIVPVLYFSTNMFVNRYIYSNQNLPITAVNVLIAGDSHTQKSINPKYFINALNISQTAEPYILTFWKLKKIFQTYTPDTLILGFAPHNISQFNDLKFSHQKWSSEMFRRSYPIEEFGSISNDILIDYKTYYKVLWKQTAFYPKKNHIYYIGEYTNNERSNVSNWEVTIKRHYYHLEKELNVSVTAINFLDSIVELCNSKNIRLVLVSNPVHPNYFENIPSQIVHEYFLLLSKYSSGHIVFDKIKEKYPDSLFADSDHLNENGAARFTSDLIQQLNN